MPAELKWHSWEKISKRSVKSSMIVSIYINGHGEESDDIWKERFRNGHS